VAQSSVIPELFSQKIGRNLKIVQDLYMEATPREREREREIVNKKNFNQSFPPDKSLFFFSNIDSFPPQALSRIDEIHGDFPDGALAGRFFATSRCSKAFLQRLPSTSFNQFSEYGK